MDSVRLLICESLFQQFVRSELLRMSAKNQLTLEAIKLEYDRPPTPKPRKEGTPSQIILCSYFYFLESTVLSCISALSYLRLVSIIDGCGFQLVRIF